MLLFVENVVDRRHRRDLAVLYDRKDAEIVFRPHVNVADPFSVPRRGSGDLVNVETVRERDAVEDRVVAFADGERFRRFAFRVNDEIRAVAPQEFFVDDCQDLVDPVGVGTLMAMPLSLPFSWGSTSETAFAAPVVVGIMDKAAARALLRSLWGRSRIFWSFV